MKRSSSGNHMVDSGPEPPPDPIVYCDDCNVIIDGTLVDIVDVSNLHEREHLCRPCAEKQLGTIILDGVRMVKSLYYYRDGSMSAHLGPADYVVGRR